MVNKKDKDFQDQLRTVTHGKALVTVGKSGITKTIREELKLQLEKKQIVKVKLLRSCGIEDYDLALEKLAEETSSVLYRRVGRTGVFISKKQPSVPKKLDKSVKRLPWQK